MDKGDRGILQIREMATELLKNAGCTAHLKIKKQFPGGRLVGGKYHPHTHTITLYTETIRRQCELLFGSCKWFMPYATIVLAHEIGHAMDENLPLLSAAFEESGHLPEKQALALTIEQNAWDFAGQLIPAHLEPLFQKIMDESLSAYRQPVMAGAY